MSIWISSHFKKSFLVEADRQQSWNLVSDVPRSAANIPELVTREAAGTSGKGLPLFKFKYKRVGIDRWNQDPSHSSEFVIDRDKWQIDWFTSKGNGNILQSGQWILEEKSEGTLLHLTVEADMELPVPRLMKLTAQPIVRKIFLTRMEQYAKNITSALRC